MSKRFAGYSLSAQMSLVTRTIHAARHEDDVEHESGEVYVHISITANLRGLSHNSGTKKSEKSNSLLI